MSNAPAAGHALAVLRLLAQHAEPLPAAMIARELGLPRSSTYHLLAVLREAGFVAHLGDHRRWVWALRRTNWVRPTPGRRRCSGSHGR